VAWLAPGWCSCNVALHLIKRKDKINLALCATRAKIELWYRQLRSGEHDTQ